MTNPDTRRKKPFSLDRSRRAFTLTELLVVMAIMAALAALGIPAVSSLTKSANVNQTLVELTGILEQARQYAVAQNTYVWVAFSPHVDPSGDIDEITVAVVASKDGLDPNPNPGGHYEYGTVPNPQLDLIARMRSFRRIELKDAGAFTATDIVKLPASPAAGTANALAASATFSIANPATGAAVIFDRCVQFTPSGSARNNANPINMVEFGLQPTVTHSATRDPNNVAVVRINGLTGQASVFRR